MKFLIVISCAFLVASAEYVLPTHTEVLHPTYTGPQHLPVIGPNGVPVDTAAVQKAKDEHLTHKVEVHARNGDLAYPHHELLHPEGQHGGAEIVHPVQTFVEHNKPAVFPVHHHSYPDMYTTGYYPSMYNLMMKNAWYTPSVYATAPAHYPAYHHGAALIGRARRDVYNPYYGRFYNTHSYSGLYPFAHYY